MNTIKGRYDLTRQAIHCLHKYLDIEGDKGIQYLNRALNIISSLQELERVIDRQCEESINVRLQRIAEREYSEG